MNAGQVPWRADFAASAPFHHVAADAAQLAGPDWPELARLNTLAAPRQLQSGAGLPLTFAAQHVHCGQWEYEASIRDGAVPSRERNWHDLLNALTWLAFPRAKATLNDLQCRHLAGRQGSTPRGPASDAGTLFDESGLLLAGTAANLAPLLQEHLWEEAFVTRRDDWANIRAYAFGHAVLEKLLAPWSGITAKCLFLQVDSVPEAGAPPAWLDQQLAETWRSGHITRPADLFPVPVLGLPGWWPGNDDAAFYRDTNVFRPVRKA